MSTDWIMRFLGDYKRYTPSYALYLRVFNDLKHTGAADSNFPPLRVAVLRNYTFEPLLPVLSGEIIRAGAIPEFFLGRFDAVAADVMDPVSQLYNFDPQVIVLAQWLESMSPALTTRFLASSPRQRLNEHERIRSHTREIVSALRARTAAPILLNNWPLPPHPTLGILDAQSMDDQTQTVLRLNADILSDLKAYGDVWIVDMLRVFAAVGDDNARDTRSWQVARAPIAQKALVPLGREYGKFFSALRGNVRKCLVLDCDNTLWGGILGEDGLSGIEIGSSYPGSCFVDFQEEILNLQARGVILALCSKNNEADVLDVVRKHPNMLLREEHISAWEINWDDKVTNLRRIALTLNIGTDSLVFIDDSQFEIDLVRKLLPEVETITLPVKASSSYRSVLARCGFFDNLAFTSEDRRKTEMYIDDRRRRVLQSAAGSLTEYLQSLKMQADITTAGEIDIARLAQLTQKTNQFNMTSRRYSESEIRAVWEKPDSDVLVLRMRDSMSDLGLVGAAIVHYSGGVAEIDSFLLSCRVIGRGVEDALLSVIVERAARRGDVRSIRGVFVPTSKNAMVASFYARHGFHQREEDMPIQIYELCSLPYRLIQCPAWLELRTGDASYARP